MSNGVNKVILIGNLGQKPEMRYTATNSAVANLSIATTESWKDRESGEMRDKTEWHKVVFFGKPAETIEKYLDKGSKIYVEGKLQTRKWQDKDGNDRWTTEIVGNQFNLFITVTVSVPVAFAAFSANLAFMTGTTNWGPAIFLISGSTL